MHQLFLLPLSLLAAIATSQRFGQCIRPVIRREWRTLSEDQREDYIEAVQCLMDRPSRSSLPAANSRYDDFVGTHIVQAGETHFVGIFYPYHRLLVSSFEQALRIECGYAGAQPYWDWTLDLHDLAASPIFDPDAGFGGNGNWVDGSLNDPEWGVPVAAHQDFPDRTGGGCIPDGPFQGMVTSLGPNRNVERRQARCVRRDLAPDTFRERCNVAECMEQASFGEFQRTSEGMAHASGHYGVGGLYGAMTDKWASRKSSNISPAADWGLFFCSSKNWQNLISRRPDLLAAPLKCRPALVVVADARHRIPPRRHFRAFSRPRLDQLERWEHVDGFSG